MQWVCKTVVHRYTESFEAFKAMVGLVFNMSQGSIHITCFRKSQDTLLQSTEKRLRVGERGKNKCTKAEILEKPKIQTFVFLVFRHIRCLKLELKCLYFRHYTKVSVFQTLHKSV